MPEIDPELMSVLGGLLESPLANLGEIAIARVLASERAFEQRPEVSRDRRTDTPRQRAYRQLDNADAAIRGIIKRELALMERLQALAREFEVGQVIAAPVEDAADGAPGLGRDPLTGELRTVSFTQFLRVWIEVADGLRARWEQRDDG